MLISMLLEEGGVVKRKIIDKDRSIGLCEVAESKKEENDVQLTVRGVLLNRDRNLEAVC